MRYIKIMLTGFIFLFFSTLFAAENSPVGYWKTIDDLTGNPKSIIKIWKTPNNILMGQVVKVFPSVDKTENKLCTACKGDKLNQPIVGMVILTGLKSSSFQWSDGKILDPENGKTYSCSVRVADKGKKLNVHGYTGLPLLGRSQTWQRVDLMEGSKLIS